MEFGNRLGCILRGDLLSREQVLATLAFLWPLPLSLIGSKGLDSSSSARTTMFASIK
jgi:hypothetical protein